MTTTRSPIDLGDTPSAVTSKNERVDHRHIYRASSRRAQQTADGLLPEQVTEHALDTERIAEWVDRWGPVATPLLWSHAMYATLADELEISGTR